MAELLNRTGGKAKQKTIYVEREEEKNRHEQILKILLPNASWIRNMLRRKTSRNLENRGKRVSSREQYIRRKNFPWFWQKEEGEKEKKSIFSFSA